MPARRLGAGGRRLLPASALTLGAILVYTALFVPGRQHPNVVGDVRAALGFVVNWRLIATQHTYAGITADPSPVQHYWSLAIEEQFYLLFPLIVALCLRRSRTALAMVLGALAAASLGAQLTIHDPTRAYFGTDTRALELLAGALLALWWVRAEARHKGPLSARVAEVAGAVGLTATVIVWAAVREHDQWLYRGGFALVSAASVALLIGALRGPATRLLGTRPLVHLGRISYGVYLLHWPVFLTLTQERVGVGGWPLFLTRVAATLALAELSFRAVEWPIRRGGVVRGVEAPLALAIAGCLLVALTVPVGKLPDVSPGQRHGRPVARARTGRLDRGRDRARRREVRPAVGRLVAETEAKVGCGFIDESQARYRHGLEETRHCADFVPSALRVAATLKPNVVLLTVGYPGHGRPAPAG